jgi:tetratricopeptide (TPR) repeat protein
VQWKVKLVVLSEPILVGREEELEKLQRSLDSVLSGKGKTILISGKAGSGKTRLTNEFLNIARKRDVTILFGWCLSNTTLPYFPFIEAFSSDIMSRGGGTMLNQPIGLKPWLSESYPIERSEKDGTIVPQFWKDKAFTAVAKELLYLSSVKPLILVLEDMHWADSASLSLLHYISRAIVNEKILILVTFRSEEIGREAEGRIHPLAETLNLMGREDLFKEIQLENLNQEHVRGIAESMAGGRVDPKLVERLTRESRGNPLFVVEFLRMLSEHGNLIREKDQWRLSVEKLGMPSKVKEVIMRRISALKPNQRRVLDVASVIGDKFDADLIASVLSKDRLEILEVLNGILKSTALVRVEENKYMFDHAKSREVLYEEISLPLKRGYHERVAEQIENGSKDSEEIPFNDLAYHFAQAGNQEKSVKYSLAAGQDALARFSNKEAIKHFSYALEYVANLEELTAERNIALEGLGDAYYANCLFEEAIKTFERLAKSETGAIRLRAYRKALDAAWFIEDDPSRMLQLVEKAEKYAALDRLEKARVLRNKGRAYFRLGDFKAALTAHEEGLRISKEEYSLPDMARDLGMTGAQRIFCGCDVKKGLGEIQRGISLQQELGNTRLELIPKVYRNIFFASFGLVQELFNEYPEMLKVGAKIGDFHSLAETSMVISEIFENLGKLEEAIALSVKALEYSSKTDTESPEPHIFAALARQYARIGDLKKANQYFDYLMKTPTEILSIPINAPWVALAEAVLFAAKSQWKEADESFQKAFEMSKKGMWQYLNLESSPIFRKNYAWALKLQGRIDEAEVQSKQIQEAEAKAVERFAHADLLADLIMKKRIMIYEENEWRLDLVNVGRGSVSIIKINELVPPNEFKVIAFPSYCRLQNGVLEMSGREISAFQVETVKLNVKALKLGVYSLDPRVVYIDDLGETRTCKPKPISITVNPRLSKPGEKQIDKTKPAKLEFRSEAARKAFDFLVKAFVQDYFHKRLVKERSGWRTLMDIVKEAPVSYYSMYGSGKHHGYAAVELERLGVVDFRIFLGERGRGGRVLKLRVEVEKDNIKNYVNQYISKGSKTTC